MNLHRSPRLPTVTCALLFACGTNPGGSDSASASGTITGVGATNPEPTTSAASDADADAGASQAETSAGSISASQGDSSTGPADTTAATSAGTGETSASSSSASVSSSSSQGESTSPTNDEPQPCQVEATEVKPIPPTVLFLLDKSGSMGDLPGYLWDHDDDVQTPDVTRWSSLHAVVESMVGKFNDTVEFGVKLYPKIDATPYKATGACDVDPGVEVETAPMNGANILAAIPPGDFNVLGGTPMESGIKEAFNYITSLDPDDQRFILMIADGDISKTCEDQNFFEAYYYIETAWMEHNIGTYVVGIAIDDLPSKNQLTMLAKAGGKPSAGPDPYYSTQNQIELDDALQQIIEDTISCTIAVDPVPDQPDLFEVWIGDTQVPAEADCDGDGWHWTAPYTEIELCGAACKQLKQSGKIEARYFCVAG